jgi:hypothetical protein
MVESAYLLWPRLPCRAHLVVDGDDMDGQKAIDRMFTELHDLRTQTHDDQSEFAKGNAKEHNRIYDKIDTVVAATSANAAAIAVLVKEVAVLHREHGEARTDRRALYAGLTDMKQHIASEKAKHRTKTAAVGAGGGGALLVVAELLRHWLGAG